MRKELRLIGFDDAPFNKFKDKNVLVIGSILRGGSLFEGILSTKVKVDGSDSTKKLISLINKSKFRLQLRAIFLDGIAFGGFNVIDITQLYKKTKIPVIVIIRRMPNLKKIKYTLTKLNMGFKFKLMQEAGKPEKISNLYIQRKGISFKKAKSILKLACTRSHIPEPIRISHLIASGIVKGESGRRA